MTELPLHDLISSARSLLLIGMLGIALQPAFAQHESTNVNVAVRQEWLQGALDRMTAFRPGPETTRIDIFDLKHFERNQLACTVLPSCYVKIGDTNWVYFVLHSAHRDPEIGDLALAIDQDGSVFECKAHVCGSTSGFITDSLEMPLTSKDFFKLFYSDDPSKSHWIPLQRDQIREPASESASSPP